MSEATTKHLYVTWKTKCNLRKSYVETTQNLIENVEKTNPEGDNEWKSNAM